MLAKKKKKLNTPQLWGRRRWLPSCRRGPLRHFRHRRQRCPCRRPRRCPSCARLRRSSSLRGPYSSVVNGAIGQVAASTLRGENTGPLNAKPPAAANIPSKNWKRLFGDGRPAPPRLVHLDHGTQSSSRGGFGLSGKHGLPVDMGGGSSGLLQKTAVPRTPPLPALALAALDVRALIHACEHP